MKKTARRKKHRQILLGTCGTISKGVTWIIFVPEAEAKMFEEIVAGDFSDTVIQCNYRFISKEG